MDEIDKHVYSTKKSIYDWMNKVENRSGGLTCANIRQLVGDPSLEDLQKALAEDRAFFYGFINELQSVL